MKIKLNENEEYGIYTKKLEEILENKEKIINNLKLRIDQLEANKDENKNIIED